MIQLDIPGLSIAFTENVYAFGGVTFWVVAAGAGVVTAAGAVAAGVVVLAAPLGAVAAGGEVLGGTGGEVLSA